MKSEAERLAERVTRLERLVIALCRTVAMHDRGFRDRFEMNYPPSSYNTEDTWEECLLHVVHEMHRSEETGQV